METRRDTCDENYLLDKKCFFNKDYIRLWTIQKPLPPFLAWLLRGTLSDMKIWRQDCAICFFEIKWFHALWTFYYYPCYIGVRNDPACKIPYFHVTDVLECYSDTIHFRFWVTISFNLVFLTDYIHRFYGTLRLLPIYSIIFRKWIRLIFGSELMIFVWSTHFEPAIGRLVDPSVHRCELIESDLELQRR